MNKKNAIVSIVLIALMCGFIVPTSVRGFETGPGAPDQRYAPYGPTLSTLWVHGYANYAGELAAIEAKTIDFIDTTLTPTDYAAMQGIGGFNFSFVTQQALDQIDWNKAFLPFNNTLYSRAVSEILQGGSGSSSEKAKFVNTWLGIGAAPCYSPNPGQIIANSGQPWYDPTTANIFTGGYSAALADLLSCGIPLAADMITGGGTTYATWNFSAPFPFTGASSYNPYHPLGTSATGYNQMGCGADNNHGTDGGITILTRTSDQRVNIGPEMQQMLGANFTWWYDNQASQSDKDSWTAALTAAGLSTSLKPRIEVVVKLVTMGQIYNPVFSYYCFETYTGGFSYGFLPSSMLENYLTSNSPQAFGWGSYHDYNCYTNPVYDGFIGLMENSTTPAAGVTYCHLAQQELMGGATYGPALFPYWVYTGYSPTEYTNYQTVPNAAYAGLGTWFSYVNGYPTAGSPGYATNSFTQGMRSPFPELPNPVSSSSYYCYIMLNEIYDTLAANNPYNMSQLIPYIATGWTSGTWLNPGTGKTCSNWTISMREDVPWQDVPGPQDRSAFTWNAGHQLDGPMMNRYMTPLDVAFSYAYGALGWGFTIAYDYSGTFKFDHVTINPVYQNAWLGQIGHNATVDGTPWVNETYVNDLYGVSGSTPLFPVYQATTPGQTPYYTTQQYLENFVRFDPNVSPEQIGVYYSVLEPWLGLYYAVGTVLLPMDIFSNLALGPWTNNGIAPGFVAPDETAMDLQPYSYNTGTGADLLYGSGPFILVDDAAAQTSVNMRLEAWVAGLTYGPGLTGTYGTDTITTATNYFWQGVRPAAGSPEPDLYEPKTMGGWLFFSEGVMENYFLQPVTVTLYFDYDITAVGPVIGSATGVSAPITFTIPAASWSGNTLVPGTKAIPYTPIVAIPHAWCVDSETIIVWSDCRHWSYTNPNTLQMGVGNEKEPGYTIDTHVGLPSDILVCVEEGPAPFWVDITGDNYIDISDGALVGLWWHKFVPPAPPNVDINGDNYIDISDGAQIGLWWHRFSCSWILTVSY